MSQIEQRFQSVLNREPEIEKCYRKGLVNRRALARYLVAQGVASNDQFDAIVATIRRHDFSEEGREVRSLFKDIRVSLKDRILILDFEKQKELLQRLESMISHINYDRGDTLKIVVGTSSLKLFIDQAKEKELGSLFDRFVVRQRIDHVSEISMLFPEEAARTRGILSIITRETDLNNIVISEFLTASPELLIYVKDQYVAKAYEVVRRLQEVWERRAGR
jgi:hypothetical protein